MPAASTSELEVEKSPSEFDLILVSLMQAAASLLLCESQ